MTIWREFGNRKLQKSSWIGPRQTSLAGYNILVKNTDVLTFRSNLQISPKIWTLLRFKTFYVCSKSNICYIREIYVQNLYARGKVADCF